MSADLRFEVSRTIVVRVAGSIDEPGSARLRRILEDLIDDHGVDDLVVDFLMVAEVGSEVTQVLDWAQQRMDDRNGRIELRLPTSPAEALIEASGEITSFVPLDESHQHGT